MRHTKYTADASREWFMWLCEHSRASSGWGGNLTGMRNKFWGKTAYVVRCCKYLFLVDEKTFDKVINNRVIWGE